MGASLAVPGEARARRPGFLGTGASLAVPEEARARRPAFLPDDQPEQEPAVVRHGPRGGQLARGAAAAAARAWERLTRSLWRLAQTRKLFWCVGEHLKLVKARGRAAIR